MSRSVSSLNVLFFPQHEDFQFTVREEERRISLKKKKSITAIYQVADNWSINFSRPEHKCIQITIKQTNYQLFASLFDKWFNTWCHSVYPDYIK